MRALLPLALMLSTPVFAQGNDDPADRFLAAEEQAFAHYRAREWDAAVAAFERQIAIFAANPRPYYNIACCYGLQGDAERAATWLELAIAHGWRDPEHLASDPDLDRVRKSDAYRRALAKLAEARRLDPDPMPRRIDPASVPAIPAVAPFLRLSAAQAQAEWNRRDLFETHQVLRRLFAVYDRRMAVLARYLMENGDAPDAADAALARVETANLYGEHAEGTGAAARRLRAASARYVLETAGQFLRGYPGSPHLARVRLLRARALPDGNEKLAELRSLIEDHPGEDPVAVARITLCATLAKLERSGELAAAWTALRGGRDSVPFHPDLVAARLLARGMPDLSDLAPAGRVVPLAFRGTVVWLFVSADSQECERLLARVRVLVPRPDERRYPVVVCVDPPERVSDADLDRWLARHAGELAVQRRMPGAVERLWLTRVPMVVLARANGVVLAVDPGAKKLAALVR